ncbi:MAG: hypothetical protein ABEJ31_00995 [Haloarculaceae archaeon]
MAGADSTLLVLVLAVLGVPPLVALIGTAVRRERGFEYAVTAASAIAAAFLLTGAVSLRGSLTVVGIVAVLAALVGNVVRYRRDRVDALVIGCIYAAPLLLGIALLVQATTPWL